MEPGKILYAKDGNILILKFEGDIRFNICSPMDKFIHLVMKDDNLEEIFVDASLATGIDSTALGVLAEIAIKAEEKLHKKPFLFVTEGAIEQIIHSVNFDKIFTVVEHRLDIVPKLTELSPSQESESALGKRVLQAHKTLMAINVQNRDKFKDVVEALERDISRGNG